MIFRIGGIIPSADKHNDCRQVAERLKLGQSVEPEGFDSVTVFFSDVVKFTILASKCSPFQAFLLAPYSRNFLVREQKCNVRVQTFRSLTFSMSSMEVLMLSSRNIMCTKCGTSEISPFFLRILLSLTLYMFILICRSSQLVMVISVCQGFQ